MKKIVRILAGLVMGLMCVNCASAKSGNEEKVSEIHTGHTLHFNGMERIHTAGFTYFFFVTTSCTGTITHLTRSSS
jgi:hypothetical protein